MLLSRNFVVMAQAPSLPLLSTNLGPTNSRSIAVKEFWFSRVEFEVLMCGGICVKFIVANFPGN